MNVLILGGSGFIGRHAASALLAGAPAIHAAAQGPALGYSPANIDKGVSPRQDFYRYAAGQWLDRAEIPASEPEISGFTELSIKLDEQLLKLIKASAAATAAPGSPRQQIVALRGASAQG